jgi:hypothetical protein
VAVAVTDSPGTSALADTGAHTLRGKNSQVGTPTHWGLPTGGFEAIDGLGNTSLLRACAARTAGAGNTTAAGGGVVSHTIVVVVVAMFVPALIPSGHVIEYQAPFSPVCASRLSLGCGTKVGSAV